MSTTDPSIRDEAIKSLRQVVGDLASDVTFEFEGSEPVLSIGDSSRTLSGTGSFNSVPDVNFTAYFTLAGKPTFFRADFPETPAAGNLNIDALARGGDWRQLLLPSDFRNRATLGSWIVDVDPKANRASRLTLNFRVAGQFSPVEGLDIGMKEITVGYVIENPLGQRKVSGLLSARLRLLGVETNLSSNLVTNWDDWRLSSDNYDVTRALPELWKLVRGDEIMPWPEFMSHLSLSKFQVDLYPTNRLELTAWSATFGDFQLVLRRSTSAGQPAPLSTQLTGGYTPAAPTAAPSAQSVLSLVLGYALPPNVPIAGSLSILNSFRPSHAGIVVSTFKEPVDSTLQILAGLGGGDTRVKQGVTFLAMVDINRYEDKNLKRLITEMCRHMGAENPLSSVLFRGNLPLPPEPLQNFSASVALTFTRSVSYFNRVFIRSVSLESRPAAGDPDFTAYVTVDVVIDKPDRPLVFRGGLGLQPASLTIAGKLQMEGVVSLPHPFGFPKVEFANLALNLGIKFSTEIPTPDNLFLSGEMRVNNIAGRMTLGLDQNEIGRNMVLARFANLDFASIIDAFCAPALAGKVPAHARDLLAKSGVRDAYVKLIPPGAAPSFIGAVPPPDPGFMDDNSLPVVRDNDYTPGFSLAGRGALLDWEGEFVFNFEGDMAGLRGGLTALARMTPIPTAAVPIPRLPGGITLVEITGQGGSGGPELHVDLGSYLLISGITPSGSQPGKVIYCSARLTLLGVTGDVHLDLTPSGFQGSLAGNILGFLRGNLQAKLANFRNPLAGTTVSGSTDQSALGIIRDRAADAIKDEFGQRMIGLVQQVSPQILELRSISFSGSLEQFQGGLIVEVRYRAAGSDGVVHVRIDNPSVEAFARRLGMEIAARSRSAFDNLLRQAEEMEKAVLAAAGALQNRAREATALAKTTAEAAAREAVKTRERLSAAGAALSSTQDEFQKVSRKVFDRFEEFGRFAQRTVEKLFRTTLSQIRNGWNDFSNEFKKVITGGDNEERVMTNGPAFRIYTRHQGAVLASSATTKKHFPITLRAKAGGSLEAWQLVPNDKIEEGSFYLVSGHSGLLIAKHRATHLTLIPHESDHKGRERMLLEPVPNEPGWYHLKYRDIDERKGVKIHTYAEVRQVVLKEGEPGFTAGVAQWVLAPVERPVGQRPGDPGKFRFEKAGDIDWARNKPSLPPHMNPAAAWVEGNRYQVEGHPEQFVFSGGVFRWIPDAETLGAGPWRDKPLIILRDDDVVAMVLGEPLPSRKDGALLQERGAPETFIMDGGRRRWIPDPQTFQMLGLNPERIQCIARPDLLAIPAGDPIPSGFIAPVAFTERALYRAHDNPRVYMVAGGILRGVPDIETLVAMGYTSDMVIGVPLQALSAIPTGPDLPSRRDGTLLQADGQPAVYILQRGIRRHIPDAQTFNAMALDWGRIQKVRPADLADIPLGPAMPSASQPASADM